MNNSKQCSHLTTLAKCKQRNQLRTSDFHGKAVQLTRVQRPSSGEPAAGDVEVCGLSQCKCGCIRRRNCHELWIGVFRRHPFRFLDRLLRVGCGAAMSVARSSSLPLRKTAPARTEVDEADVAAGGVGLGHRRDRLTQRQLMHRGSGGPWPPVLLSIRELLCASCLRQNSWLKNPVRLAPVLIRPVMRSGVWKLLVPVL